MIKTKLFCCLILYLSLFDAEAQISDFSKEFENINKEYNSLKNIIINQQYLFSLDSSNSNVFESGYCYIEKQNNVMFYEFGDVEAFSDGTYSIKVSNEIKFILITKINRVDSIPVGFLFSEGMSQFKNYTRTKVDNDLLKWSLTEGKLGVLSVDITYNPQTSRIISILAELSAEHPFISQLNNNIHQPRHNVFVRINYSYPTERKSKLPQLSNYILIQNDSIIPVEKYRDYKIKIIK